MALTPAVVNVWSKAVTGTGASGTNGYIYGTAELTISNTPGNWLFGIVQWDETNVDPNTIVWLADDAHNYWQHTKLSASGHTLRTAILTCPNAMATPTPGGSLNPGSTQVYLSSTGFIRNPILTIVEVSGMQPGYVVDLAAVAFASNTSITVSGTTTAADFVLAACTHRFASGSIAITGTGWTTTGQVASNSTDSNVLGMQGASAYQYMASPGTPSITFTNDNHDWTAVLIGIKAQGGLPVNAFNPAWPIITCQAAFGVLPGNVTDQYGWTDITPRFLGIKGSYGKDYELDQMSAGDFVITLDNHDGGLNPFNASGPYYPNVKLVTPIRVILTWQGRVNRSFEGQIEFLPASYEEQFGVIEAECSDTFAKLPQIRLQSAMCQEIMYDNPLFYWPLIDPAGSLFASNLSGNTFTTLEKVTSKFGNGGAAADFGSTPVPALKGDQGTVFAQSGVAFGTPWKGTSLRCIDDTLPSLANPAAWEFWFKLPTTGVTNPGTLLTVEGGGSNVGGVIFQVEDATGTINVVWFDSNQVQQSITTGIVTNYEDNAWHHYHIRTTSTSIALFIDGVSVASNNATSFVSNNPEAIELFGVTNRFVNNNTPVFANGSAAHLVCYNYQPEIERVQEHYNSGHGGFAGEDTGQRVMRLLRYADWGKPQAIDSGISLAQRLDYMGSGQGYGSGGLASSFGLFGSFGPQHPSGSAGASGTQADLAVQDMGLTENGSVYIDRNGTLFFKNRDNLYNGGLRATFSDGFFPMNKNYRLSDTSNWAVNNTGNPLALGTGTWALGQLGSLLWTADGVTANPLVRSERIPVQGSTSYQVDTWMMCVQGYATGQLGITWRDSSGTFISSVAGSSFNLNPLTPGPFSFRTTSPSNAATGEIFIQGLGTPANGTQFLASRPVLSSAGFSVPYMDDIIINFDVSFLYNDVSVTRNIDQAFSRVVDLTSKGEYFTRTYTRTIYSPSGSDANDVTDNANWVLNAYREPKYRIESMTVDAGSNPDLWEIVNRLDIGDVVSFSRTAPGTVPVVANFIVLKISPTITQDIGTFEYALGPILNPVLTLDDPITGLIGSSYIGF